MARWTWVVWQILPVAPTIKRKKQNKTKSDRLSVLRSEAQLDQIILASPKNYKLKHFCLSFAHRTQTPKAPPAASVSLPANHLFQQPTVQICLPPVSFPSQISATLPNITSSEIQFGALTDSSWQALLQTEMCLRPPSMHLLSSLCILSSVDWLPIFFFLRLICSEFLSPAR